MDKPTRAVITAFAVYMMAIFPFSVWWGGYIAKAGFSFSLGLAIVTLPWMIPMYLVLAYFMFQMWSEK